MPLWSLLSFLSAFGVDYAFFSQLPIPPLDSAALSSHRDTLGGHDSIMDWSHLGSFYLYSVLLGKTGMAD